MGCDELWRTVERLSGVDGPRACLRILVAQNTMHSLASRAVTVLLYGGMRKCSCITPACACACICACVCACMCMDVNTCERMCMKCLRNTPLGSAISQGRGNSEQTLRAKVGGLATADAKGWDSMPNAFVVRVESKMHMVSTIVSFSVVSSI